MHIQVDRSRSLRIDGVDLGMATATKVTGGAASIETIKPEDTSESEATFDGWLVRRVTLSILVHPRPGEDRYDALAAIGAMARAETQDVPQQHTLESPMTDALRISRVICLSTDPVEEQSDSDEIRLTALLEEVDPTVALEASSRAAASASAAEEEAEEGQPPPTEETQADRELYWAGDY